MSCSVEITLIKNEVEELKSTFPKLVEKTRENQSNMLNQIQSEIKSLKSLLLNRRPMDSTSPLTALTSSFAPNPSNTTTATHHPISTSNTTTASSSSSVLAGVHFGKPSIPAWQIAAKKEKEEKGEEKKDKASSQSIDDDVDGGGGGDVRVAAERGKEEEEEKEKKKEKEKRDRSQSPLRRKGAKSPAK